MRREQADLYALVLIARGIGSTIVADARAFNVLVATKDAVRASYEFTAYDAENQRRPATQADGETGAAQFRPASGLRGDARVLLWGERAQYILDRTGWRSARHRPD